MYFSPWRPCRADLLSKIPTPSGVVFLTDGGIGYSSGIRLSPNIARRRAIEKPPAWCSWTEHAQCYKGDEIAVPPASINARM